VKGTVASKSMNMVGGGGREEPSGGKREEIRLREILCQPFLEGADSRGHCQERGPRGLIKLDQKRLGKGLGSLGGGRRRLRPEEGWPFWRSGKETKFWVFKRKGVRFRKIGEPLRCAS